MAPFTAQRKRASSGLLAIGLILQHFQVLTGVNLIW